MVFLGCAMAVVGVVSQSVIHWAGLILPDFALSEKASMKRWCLRALLKAGRVGMKERWYGNAFPEVWHNRRKRFQGCHGGFRWGNTYWQGWRREREGEGWREKREREREREREEREKRQMERERKRVIKRNIRKWGRKRKGDMTWLSFW